LFVIFFWLSFFSLGGIVVLTYSYLKDFFSKELLSDVQNNVFLAFGLSELIGALMKLIIYDWRRFNMFAIAAPFFVVAVASLVILKQSPYDMI
jgi:predicted MFS family arabinose efflux permease